MAQPFWNLKVMKAMMSKAALSIARKLTGTLAATRTGAAWMLGTWLMFLGAGWCAYSAIVGEYL